MSQEEGEIITDTFQLKKHLTVAHKPQSSAGVGKYDKSCEVLNEQVSHIYADIG